MRIVGKLLAAVMLLVLFGLLGHIALMAATRIDGQIGVVISDSCGACH